MKSPTLFELLQQQQAPQPEMAPQGVPMPPAPLPTGNLGAGASSPLQLGPMVADAGPNLDPRLVNPFIKGFKGVR